MPDDSPLLIQKLRLQRGWSQEQLAEITGLSVRTIQRIERGQTPSAESLKALAAVLDVNFGALREAHMSSPASPAANVPSSPGVSTDEALALARVRKIKGFYRHVIQYVVIVGFLVAVNLLTFPRYFWAGWTALAWGLGLALHGLQVFDKIPFLNADWERRTVEKYLGRKL
jgi:transcriptional regulator with XRE-family HTH domain